MLCRNCGCSEWEHEQGFKCPTTGGGFFLSPSEDLDFNKPIRQFTSGATRDSDTDKLDYEGFLSPIVLKRFAEYMHKNRIQSDGSLRDSDNWQKGIPEEAYAKSLLRHVIDVWRLRRISFKDDKQREELREALCAVMFNSMGYLFEVLR